MDFQQLAPVNPPEGVRWIRSVAVPATEPMLSFLRLRAHEFLMTPSEVATLILQSANGPGEVLLVGQGRPVSPLNFPDDKPSGQVLRVKVTGAAMVRLRTWAQRSGLSPGEVARHVLQTSRFDKLEERRKLLELIHKDRARAWQSPVARRSDTTTEPSAEAKR